MAGKNDGACGNPKLIRTDVDCRAARPKFNEGAWSPAKISDMTGGGLYEGRRRPLQAYAILPSRKDDGRRCSIYRTTSTDSAH